MKKTNITIALILLSLFTFSTSVYAQTAYYNNLLQELNTQYGLTGGELVIGGNENLLQQGIYTNINPQFNTVSGQAFQQSVQLNVASAGPNLWSQSSDFVTATSIANGDVLLLVAWVRNLNNGGEDDMAFSFQERFEPWSNSHYSIQDIPANGLWQRIFLPMDANLNHPAGQSILQLHLGLNNISFEIGGLAVINFRQRYQLSDLPQQEVRNYYVDLIAELSNDYGLNGGQYVIGGNENLLQQANHINIAPQFNSPTDQPFQLAAQLMVNAAGPNPWSQSVNYLTIADVALNDVLLLSCFIRNHGDGTIDQMAFSFQELNDPWGNSHYEVVDIPANDQWYRVFFPLTADLAHPTAQTMLQLHLGFENIDFEIGGLALINFKQLYTEADLPKQEVLYYEGIEENAAWRIAANNRIDQHRKTNLTVTVVDVNHNPVENASVHFDMQNAAFKYGSFEAAALLDPNPNLDFYQSEFYRLFNYGTVGIYWSGAESDNYDLALSTTNILLQNGLDVRLHPALWGFITSNWSSMPNDVQQALNQGNAAYVRQRINQRLPDVTNRFKDLVTDYDVLNEPSHVTNLQDLLGTNEPLVWFQKMRQEDPNNQLFINDYEILSLGAQLAPRNAYKNVIENLLMQNAPIDGVGFQGHIFDTPTPPERVYNVIEEFYQLGLNYGQQLDFKITEYDTEGMGDQLAAQYLGDFLIAIFSHPQVSSFTMWGFWDGLHWLDDAPLYYQDFTPKPALAVYENLLFDQWWTDESRTTASNGVATLRAFKGDYLIRVSSNGKTAQQWINLSGDRSIKIQFDQVLATEGLDFSVRKWQKKAALLEWTSFTQGNTAYFEIQRSDYPQPNGNGFTTLHRLNINNDNNPPRIFKYIDEKPSFSYNYYRIKEVAKDGNTVYSEVKILDFSDKENKGIRLLPSLVQKGENVLVENLSQEVIQHLEVINMMGERIFQQNAIRSNFSFETTHFTKGIYFVNAFWEKEKKTLKLLVF